MWTKYPPGRGFEVVGDVMLGDLASSAYQNLVYQATLASYAVVRDLQRLGSRMLC